MAKTKTQCPVGRAMKSAGFKTPQQVERKMRRHHTSFDSPRKAEARMKRGRR